MAAADIGSSDLANPPVSRFVRSSLVSVCVGVILGIALLVPSLGIPRWPWEIAPFNARFIGVFYLAAWLGAIYAAWVGRQSPIRAFFRDAATFTVVASLLSLLQRETFRVEDRPVSVAIWFLTYIGFSAALLIGLRMMAPLPEPGAPASPSRARWMGLYALLTAGYGLALLAVPAIATGFWPWPVDDFHARLYAGIFFSGTMLLVGLRRHATPMDHVRAGIQQAVLGLGAIWATWSVDRAVDRVDWSAGGTWLWMALFGAVGLAGLGMLYEGLRANR